MARWYSWGLSSAVLLCLLGSYVYGSIQENGQEEGKVQQEHVQVEKEEESPCIVYITGAVRKPGVYALSSPKRGYEVLTLAGGAMPYAEEKAVNLADIVKDGTHLHIPYALYGEEKVPIEEGKVSLNQGTKSELESLPGVGEATAEKIIEYRKTKGRFEQIEEVMEVKGIGQSKFDKMKEKITL